MEEIYLFSGLGADHRAFQYLDFSGYKLNFIDWLPPEKNQTIEEYAARLTTQIKSNNPVLIGLSFGGLIAIEVAKLIQTKRIILIASAKTFDEIPFYYRAFGKVGFHKLLPVKFFKSSNRITNWLFGAENESDKKLLKEILEDTDPLFLKWALDQVVYWKNTTFHPNLKHIHGSADRILPIRYVNNDLTVNKGSHLMTVNRHAELSEMIRSFL